MNKRDFLKGSVAATAVLGTSLARAETDACGRAADPATFVLVHGAWCGGWVWDDVVPILEAAGHRVFAPTLTGLADRGHLLAPGLNHATHVADVVNLIRWHELRDIVLVGHSYGGTVLSVVAEEAPVGAIGSIVYLDAIYAVVPGAQVTQDFAVDAGGLTTINGVPCLPPIPALGLTGEAAVRFERLMTPMPVTAFPQAAPDTAAVERIAVKTFVLAARNVAPFGFQPEAERLRGNPSWRLREIDSGHNTMIEKPRETAALLTEAAA